MQYPRECTTREQVIVTIRRDRILTRLTYTNRSVRQLFILYSQGLSRLMQMLWGFIVKSLRPITNMSVEWLNLI